jgi:hypothetical protein
VENSANSLSKPMREFCAGGPIPKEGYYVLRDRPEIKEIIDKKVDIDDTQYQI